MPDTSHKMPKGWKHGTPVLGTVNQRLDRIIANHDTGIWGRGKPLNKAEREEYAAWLRNERIVNEPGT